MILPDPTSPAFAALAATLREPISDPPTVAQQLAVYRLARGVTQTELAARAGVRRATVADVESARDDGRNPSLATLAALARGLGVTLYVYP
jgi:transcriptional regulator with XRE-family HTH domain